MKSITNKEHYIWRGYLKRWTDDGTTSGKIYVHDKHAKKTYFTSIKNIGYKKHYYEVTEDKGRISELDVAVLEQYINTIIPNNILLIKMNQDKILKLFENMNTSENLNTFENIVGTFENIDNENNFLQQIIDNDLSFYNDNINHLQSIKILCGNTENNDTLENLLKNDK